jgi:hypothetical protein
MGSPIWFVKDAVGKCGVGSAECGMVGRVRDVERKSEFG